jgi:hypothetical protein
MTLYEVLMNEDIDGSIREVLIKLNTAGYDTKYSCSGAPRDHRGDRKIGLDEISLSQNRTRCYLVLMVNDKERSSYIKELREKLYGTGWYVQYTFNPHWRWWPNTRHWYHLAHNMECIDRITLEYKCEFLDEKCQKVWNVLLERLL